jgi:hypothetical protein
MEGRVGYVELNRLLHVAKAEKKLTHDAFLDPVNPRH